MPIYEYRCKSCNHPFEALIRGRETAACPECSGEDLERLTSLPTVHSSGTHGLAMKAAKKRDKAQAGERLQERLKYEESHDRHG